MGSSSTVTRFGVLLTCLLVMAAGLVGSAAEETAADDSYLQLLALFERWRQLEPPAFDGGGVPDYTPGALEAERRQLEDLFAELAAIDPSGWPVEQRVDHALLRAEMNGLDFNLRVLRPWARDPAFYQSVWTDQSDTPAHEGPTNHALIEIWQYSFPLSDAEAARLAAQLATVAPLLEQARGNLVGNARDLWISGIETMRLQGVALEQLADRIAAGRSDLRAAVDAALDATRSFVIWLEEQAPTKDGPSGIGRDDYTWSLQNVHLVPMTWQDEVRLLERELDRAWASLALEEQRNRELPQLEAIASPEEYDERANRAVDEYLDFLDRTGVLEVRDYMDAALRARIGRFVPSQRRNFFQTAIHYEPKTLWTHFYHWWDLARMEVEPHPSPVRRGPVLYNIFDSRAEGLATGMEEMMLHAGLYDDNPRAREIVWIMLAQRAARGLASLYAQSNDFTMKEARDFHVEWTPRGWMRRDLDLLGFEQQLYLRQPGYGTSYVTGKFLLERLLTERRRALGEAFELSEFFAEVDACGVIPVSLIRWQLTGRNEDLEPILAAWE